MILFVLTAFSIVVSQVCETNSTLGLNIYPTTGSPFVMPFKNYFSGSGLQYSVTPAGLFSPFQSNTQDEKTNAGVASYQEPSYYQKNTVLNFKAFYSEFDEPLQNVFLTPNGTLIYQIGAPTGAVSQLYITSKTYLGINASQSYATVTNNGASSVASVPVLLGARNNFTSVSQKLLINVQIENGKKFVQPTDKKWFFVGFGLAFAAVIFGTIGWLCYQSRPQSAAYSQI